MWMWIVFVKEKFEHVISILLESVADDQFDEVIEKVDLHDKERWLDLRVKRGITKRNFLCIGWYETRCAIWYHLNNLKNVKKHPWRSATFKPANLLKVTLPHGSFSRFLDCTNGTKSHKTSHILAKHLRLKLFVSFSANYLMKTWD